MNRAQLEHVIRAAAANADTTEIIVVGSQAILASEPFPRSPVLTRSMEADVFPKDDPSRSILIDGAIGEKSVFHETFGYYAHGVGEETAVLPNGWKKRLIPIRNENTRGCTGWCLEPNDLALSKLIAGRQKDLEFIRCLFEEGLAAIDTVAGRIDQVAALPAERAELARARLKALKGS